MRVLNMQIEDFEKGDVALRKWRPGTGEDVGLHGTGNELCGRKGAAGRG